MPIAPYTCVECKTGGHDIEYTNRPDLRGLCFNCDFWLEKVRWREAKNLFTIVTPDFEHKRIGFENAKGFRGYGGRKFIVHFDDGRVVITTNLWHQGTVPERFRDRLTPNARIE